MNKPNSDTAEGLAEGLTWLIAHGFQFVNLDRPSLLALRAVAIRSNLDTMAQHSDRRRCFRAMFVFRDRPRHFLKLHGREHRYHGCSHGKCS